VFEPETFVITLLAAPSVAAVVDSKRLEVPDRFTPPDMAFGPVKSTRPNVTSTPPVTAVVPESRK
jgi:hypothetical protein